jgi:hypothetical protein
MVSGCHAAARAVRKRTRAARLLTCGNSARRTRHRQLRVKAVSTVFEMKPIVGLIVGAILGLLDGVSAWAYPDARPMIAAIVIGSTAKGMVTGVVAGMIAMRVRSTLIGVAAGLLVGLVLSIIIAASSTTPDGSHHYFEIVLPGMLLGAIVGFVTQRTRLPHGR